MEGFLFLGFLVGMQHALEADHLAAVSTLFSEGGSARRLALRGAAWGVGHTITLFAICGAAVSLGLTLGARQSAALEMAVGTMLVLLGINVIAKFRARRIHFHAHRHAEGSAHVHAHSHDGATQPHDRDPHQHRHPDRLPLKALVIGLVHGAAGSAALLALTVAATGAPLMALGYIAVFGLGSIVGMAALSAVVAWPLGLAERRLQFAHHTVCLAAGGLAVALGLAIVGERAPLVLGLN